MSPKCDATCLLSMTPSMSSSLKASLVDLRLSPVINTTDETPEFRHVIEQFFRSGEREAVGAHSDRAARFQAVPHAQIEVQRRRPLQAHGLGEPDRGGHHL